MVGELAVLENMAPGTKFESNSRRTQKGRDSCTPVGCLDEVGSVWLNSVRWGPRDAQKVVEIIERCRPHEVVAARSIRA